MVIKYKWGNGAGADLDTFTGIVNTGVAALDNKFVGYGGADISGSIRFFNKHIICFSGQVMILMQFLVLSLY
jgi:hypothetical protein